MVAFTGHWGGLALKTLVGALVKGLFMRKSIGRPQLDLGKKTQSALIEGARDTLPVKGLTHGFYKYPARFSPAFARAVIEAFTKPGDLVLDPHVGGGTTVVEALAAGRDAIGVDISPLAEFITKVKSTVFSHDELKRLGSWASQLPNAINIHNSSFKISNYAELGYYKHLNDKSRWRLRKAIEQGVAFAVRLGTPQTQIFWSMCRATNCTMGARRTK